MTDLSNGSKKYYIWIYKHLPSPYTRKFLSFFGSIIGAISIAIRKIAVQLTFIRDNAFIGLAHTSKRIGTTGVIRGLPGIEYLYVSDDWPETQMEITIQYRASDRSIQLSHPSGAVIQPGNYPLPPYPVNLDKVYYPRIYLQDIPDEVNLTSNDSQLFVVQVNPDEYSDMDVTVNLKLEARYSEDYLCELGKNRNKYKFTGETDSNFRNRISHVGLASERWRIRQALFLILHQYISDIKLIKFEVKRETWEKYPIIGVSFFGYDGNVPGVYPPSDQLRIPARYLASYVIERNKRIYRYKVYIPHVIPAYLDAEIEKYLESITMFGVNFSLERYQLIIQEV